MRQTTPEYKRFDQIGLSSAPPASTPAPARAYTPASSSRRVAGCQAPSGGASDRIARRDHLRRRGGRLAHDHVTRGDLSGIWTRCKRGGQHGISSLPVRGVPVDHQQRDCSTRYTSCNRQPRLTVHRILRLDPSRWVASSTIVYQGGTTLARAISSAPATTCHEPQARREGRRAGMRASAAQRSSRVARATRRTRQPADWAHIGASRRFRSAMSIHGQQPKGNSRRRQLVVCAW